MSDSDQSIAEYLAGPGGGGAFLPSKIAEDLADALVNENVCGFMFAKPAHPCGGMRAWGGVWGVGVFCLFVCSVRRRCAALPARGGFGGLRLSSLQPGSCGTSSCGAAARSGLGPPNAIDWC